ncbi:MAG TPA: bifunctional glycosyltransferase family 2/GtrA family protein [Candidatus Limnocylindria bacterium]|nr:bifunctional glycosyltransferase family 2/GtrA family protein [Candidatus Limnocylindria bacterium]
MTARTDATTLPPTSAFGPTLDVVVPVFNEERDLEPSVRRLRAYLDDRFPFPARITIADNASTDRTWTIADRLRSDLHEVRAIHLDRKGRGRALRTAWLASDAPVLAYMDVDLSTDLDALLPLVAPLLSGHSQIAIGSRLAAGARVVRGPKRELISRCYNLLLRTLLGVRFRDAQCGFKALRADVARDLLPLVGDEAWFFDTELLVLAERAGLRIHEVPVDWVDDADSSVQVVATAVADLRGVWRLMWTRGTLAPWHSRRRPVASSVMTQARRFAAIGVVSTLAYAGLYALLRGVASAPLANAVALTATAVGNTAANRRLTFGVRGRGSLGRHHLAGLLAHGVALSITTPAAALLAVLAPQAGRPVELAVLIAANTLATIARFVLLRSWIAGGRRAAPTSMHLEGTTT